MARKFSVLEALDGRVQRGTSRGCVQHCLAGYLVSSKHPGMVREEAVWLKPEIDAAKALADC